MDLIQVRTLAQKNGCIVTDIQAKSSADGIIRRQKVYRLQMTGVQNLLNKVAEALQKEGFTVATGGGRLVANRDVPNRKRRR
jgi:hypothetical protein